MTEREKEAVDYFKKRIDICIENANICDENNFDEEATFLRKEQLLIETVLHLLETKNAEIEKKDMIIDEMAEHIVSSAIVDDTVCAIKCDCDDGVDCSHKKMLKCTKEYFKKKAEEK